MINIYIEVTGDSAQVKYQLPVEDLDFGTDKVPELQAALQRFAARIMDLVQS